MNRIMAVLGLLVLLTSTAFAQELSNAGSYGDDKKPAVSTGDLWGVVSTKDISDVFFLEAAVLMNITADEYVASFGVQGDGLTSLASEQSVDSRIDSFKSSLSAAGFTETFVDFINQVPYFEYDTSGKTATEKLKGYKTAKNILIRYKDRNALRKITNTANAAGIYDLIKIDFVVNDFSGFKTKMLTEAAKIIKAKEQTYATLGVVLKPVGVVKESFHAYSPDELYQDYAAYESGSALGYKKVVNKAKASTSFYNGYDGKEFDLTINQAGLEPNIQAVMYLKVKYLPTVTPDVKCCETKDK